MPALRQAPVGSKKLLVKNEKQLNTIFSRVFSPRFYEKVAARALRYFKVTPENIVRVNQYVSDDKGHCFVNIFFKNKRVLTSNDNRLFQKEFKRILNNAGYSGSISNKKYTNLYGSSRKAVEVPMIWKSKVLGGCYCMLFERFS